jgi:hypothetical protein
MVCCKLTGNIGNFKFPSTTNNGLLQISIGSFYKGPYFSTKSKEKFNSKNILFDLENKGKLNV